MIVICFIFFYFLLFLLFQIVKLRPYLTYNNRLGEPIKVRHPQSPQAVLNLPESSREVWKVSPARGDPDIIQVKHIFGFLLLHHIITSFNFLLSRMYDCLIIIREKEKSSQLLKLKQIYPKWLLGLKLNQCRFVHFFKSG